MTLHVPIIRFLSLGDSVECLIAQSLSIRKNRMPMGIYVVFRRTLRDR